MILIWFNPNNAIYYSRYYKHYICNEYYVGYTNSYNHIVVQMFILQDHNILNVNDYYDYMYKIRYSQKENKILKFFKTLI